MGRPRDERPSAVSLLLTGEKADSSAASCGTRRSHCDRRDALHSPPHSQILTLAIAVGLTTAMFAIVVRRADVERHVARPRCAQSHATVRCDPPFIRNIHHCRRSGVARAAGARVTGILRRAATAHAVGSHIRPGINCGVIINEALARKYLPDGSPIGRRIKALTMEESPGRRAEWLT